MLAVARPVSAGRQGPLRIGGAGCLRDGRHIEPAEPDDHDLDMPRLERAHDLGESRANAGKRSAAAQIVDPEFDDGDVGIGADGGIEATQRAGSRVAVKAGTAPNLTISMRSIGPSSTLRPGESDTLFKISLAGNVPAKSLTKHSITLDICYCSLNDSCWNLHAIPGQITPRQQPVSQCASDNAIESMSYR